ncbi:MAG: hypothetical protein ACRD1W_22890 [Vicinamibacterales bacterium]
MRSHTTLVFAFAIGLVTAVAALEPAQALTVENAIGRWRSVEQFEGESRFSFAFKQDSSGISGWAVLLGQTRKGDNRAILALTFYGAKWDKDRLRFETMLPEDGGAVGWELRPVDATRATLHSLTINGVPLDDDDLAWDMVR